MTTSPLAEHALLLHPDDDVAVALRDLPPGLTLTHGELSIPVTAAIPQGHKISVRTKPTGSAVRKYGQTIGRTTVPVNPGDHVHTHNLAMDAVRQTYEFGTERIRPPRAAVPRTFEGFERGGGAAGTRNYVGIVTSVNCSASTARMIADQFRGPIMDAYPNVDGVVALAHDSGCGMVPASEGGQILRRTLRGYAAHPNVGALLVVGAILAIQLGWLA